MHWARGAAQQHPAVCSRARPGPAQPPQRVIQTATGNAHCGHASLKVQELGAVGTLLSWMLMITLFTGNDDYANVNGHIGTEPMHCAKSTPRLHATQLEKRADWYKVSAKPFEGSALEGRPWTLLSQVASLHASGLTDPADPTAKVLVELIGSISDFKQILEMCGMSIKGALNLPFTTMPANMSNLLAPGSGRMLLAATPNITYAHLEEELAEKGAKELKRLYGAKHLALTRHDPIWLVWGILHAIGTGLKYIFITFVCKIASEAGVFQVSARARRST